MFQVHLPSLMKSGSLKSNFMRLLFKNQYFETAQKQLKREVFLNTSRKSESFVAITPNACLSSFLFFRGFFVSLHVLIFDFDIGSNIDLSLSTNLSNTKFKYFSLN